MSSSEYSLSDHHRDLQAHFQCLITRCSSGDPIEVRCEWALFERELNEHMDLEEKALIPRLRRVHPAEAARICSEHREIRVHLAALGIAVDLCRLAAADVATFMERLADHARREEALFYPWARDHAPSEARPPLARLAILSRNIGAAFGVASAAVGPHVERH